MGDIDTALWQTLSPLLDELLDLDEAACNARLGQIRSADATLAASLTKLLAKQHVIEATDFLESPPLSAVSESLLPNLRVGNYTLVRPLGHGGMGVVWLAQRSDGRYEGQAAIKFLNISLSGAGGIERFQREGSMLARLTHPSIARLIDSALTDQGQPYLVLEYVDGEPIDRWCTHHDLDIRGRVRLVLEVLAAVEHAHGKLILHRDLKPANIMVTREGAVKLLDFGIAKLLDDEGSTQHSAPLTALNAQLFTLDYASPEQVQGAEMSIVSDVYSLGVLLYELLTGRHPTASEGQSPIARMRAIVEVEPARPSDALATDASADGSTRSRVRALRGDLDTIVLKALKADTSQRYASVAALAEDLERYLSNEPVRARPTSTWYQARKFAARNRGGVAAAATVVISLVAGLLIATSQLRVARAERQRADDVKQFIASIFRAADPYQDGAAPISAVELLANAKARIDPEMRDQPEVGIELLQIVGEAQMNLDRHTEALRTLQAALDLAKDAHLSSSLHAASAMATLAQVHAYLRDLPAAMTQADAAVASLRHLGKQGAPQLANALSVRSDILSLQDMQEAALAGAREAVAVAQASLGERHRVTVSASISLVVLLSKLKRHEESLRVAERVYAIATSMRAPSGLLSEIEFVYGFALAENGDPASAMALMQRAVLRARELYGNGSYTLSQRLEGLAITQERAGDLTGALASLEEAVAGPRTIHRNEIRGRLGWMLLRAKRYPAARTVLKQVLDEAGNYQDPQTWVPAATTGFAITLAMSAELDAASQLLQQNLHADSARVETLTGLALIARLRGDLDASETLLLQSIAAVSGATGIAVQAEAWTALGQLQLARKQWSAAEAALLKAEMLYRGRYRQTLPSLADVLIARGEIALARGQFSAAVPLLAEAEECWKRVDPEHQLTKRVAALRQRALTIAGARP